MMESTISDDTPLSPLRHVLCSNANATRVARWMRHDGTSATIVATCDPLQPWRIVKAATISKDARACA